MPPDSGAEFDIHLAESVRALEDLRSSSSTDIFISYCTANLPGSPDDDKLHPRTVRDDLKKAGYKWYVN